MNVKLLRKVAKHILAEPKRYAFGWVQQSSAVPCGTKACIAGWTILLGARLRKSFDENGQLIIPKSLWRRGFGYYSGPASKLLKINHAQASRLFVNWPSQFDNLWGDAATAVKRIEHFIKTKGKE